MQNEITLTFGNAFDHEFQIIKNILNININKPYDKLPYLSNQFVLYFKTHFLLIILIKEYSFAIV